MAIGIDASRAFLPERTGIEEYSYQVIKHLRESLQGESVFLYIRSEQEVDFELPKNWQVKKLWAPRLWTQVRLSLEMLFHPVEVLFIPAHTVPVIHPQKTVVVVHGLEYEFCQGAYSFFERWYMRLSIRYSCLASSMIVAVSENTKSDLMRLYGVPQEKIVMIYEGCAQNSKFQIPNSKINSNIKNPGLNIQSKFKIQNSKFLLFIGRLEERKNVVRIIEAFGILKETYQIPHQLVLAGKPGYGYQNIKYQISNIKYRDEIVESGYVSEEEKWELLKHADVFVFPSLYEGFGIPVLEAQSVGTPVVTSSIASLPEVAGEGAVFVDPLSVESIAEGVWEVLSDAKLRDGIIDSGKRNVERFSWKGCAEEVVTTFSKRNERK